MAARNASSFIWYGLPALVQLASLGSTSSCTAGAGRGIQGMRERCGLLGGELTAGPRLGGGFEVKARLPLTPAGLVRQ